MLTLMVADMELYHFLISEIEFSISSGVLPAWHGAGKPPKVYDETLHLDLIGEVQHPDILRKRPVCLSIYGSHEIGAELARPREKRTKSEGIGFVDFWGKNQTACVWLSVDAAASVHDLVRRITPIDVMLTGDQMNRRRAAIRHFYVGSKFDREDWY